MREDCGLDLFRDFSFEDLPRAKPPDEKGVYVIRVRTPGIPPDEILQRLVPRISRFGWKMAEDYLLDRIGRIRNIGECPILYIGSAGTGSTRRQTLASRYRDLTRRHTAQFSIWALLYFGWKLDFGWKVTENPREEETDLKTRYLNRGRRALPALVVR
jgi:hypothetical protein